MAFWHFPPENLQQCLCIPWKKKKHLYLKKKKRQNTLVVILFSVTLVNAAMEMFFFYVFYYYLFFCIQRDTHLKIKLYFGFSEMHILWLHTKQKSDKMRDKAFQNRHWNTHKHTNWTHTHLDIRSQQYDIINTGFDIFMRFVFSLWLHLLFCRVTKVRIH